MSVVACASHVQKGQLVAANSGRCSSPTASTCSGLSRATSLSSILSDSSGAAGAGCQPQSGTFSPEMQARGHRIGASVTAPPRAATAARPRPLVVEQSRSMTVMRSRPRANSVVAPSSSGLPILPGDVLFVKGNGNLAEIGTTGGSMGHVLLVVAPPVPILPNSKEACELQDIWPAENVPSIWRIPTIESTRASVGLHLSHMLAHLEFGTGRLILIGEIAGLDPSGALSRVENEVAEIWQSPTEVRLGLCANMMTEVLREMLECQSSWSLTTAARAVLMSADLRWSNDEVGFVNGVEESWETAPICTSVVISFWQRYLCKYARCTGQSEMSMILKFMPVKADRGLPGELIAAMQKCGWRPMNREESVTTSHPWPQHSGLSVQLSQPPLSVPSRTSVSRMRSDSALHLSPGSRFRAVVA